MTLDPILHLLTLSLSSLKKAKESLRDEYNRTHDKKLLEITRTAEKHHKELSSLYEKLRHDFS